MKDKKLPHNLDAERAVLGACLLNGAALAIAAAALKPEHFFFGQHQRIFRRALAMREEAHVVDLVTICDALQRDGVLEAAGGIAYISTLIDGVSSVTNVVHYAHIVREKALRRNLIHAADSIQQQAFDGGEDTAVIMVNAQRLIAGLLNETTAPVSGAAPDGAALAARVYAFIRRFLILTDAQANVVTSWVFHTWSFQIADAAPYLHVASPEKRRGKTRLLEVLALLVARPWLTGRVSSAILARKVDTERPTLLLDESDAAFSGPEEYKEVLRGLLNTGYRRGGCYSVYIGQGANIGYKDFSTFSPKVIAGLGKLPDTVADRAIPIQLRRRAPNEQVDRFWPREIAPEAAALRRDLAAWAEEWEPRFEDARPEIPAALNDRQANVCEPLLAIADAIGGEWPERVRRALLEILSGQGAEDDSVGVRLLADIRQVFDARADDRISSQALCDALAQIETSPWAEWNHGKPVSPNKLARLLGKFEIAPTTVRIGDKTPKGYLREDFRDAFVRYLSGAVSDTRPQTATSATKPIVNELQPKRDATSAISVALSHDAKSQGTKHVSAVASSKPHKDDGNAQVVPANEQPTSASSEKRPMLRVEL